eukprot:GHVO01021245.1.p1 GENE.GHVO01021245.1~~GHVO01021245.1.p1  ORF type:complete len:196 (-),score=8.99 GHVO01021245.1:265-852(-)
MKMQEQANRTTKAGYFHLRTINRIRKNLDVPTCAKAINATITSRLDYHNALISGAHQCVMKPMQRLQNHAARMLTMTNRTEHITPVLEDLNWLPVKERSDYKILTFVHNALHDEHAPAYMKEMYRIYQPNRALRSGDDSWTLTVGTAARHEGRRSPAIHGAVMWNTLSEELRRETSVHVFKKKLKTFLYHRAFHN